MRVSVRLAGVDTPEMNGKCEDEKQRAREAKSLLKSLRGGRGGKVTLKGPKRGKYAGRVVSRVIVRGGHDATTRMIKSNQAMAVLMMAGSGRVGVVISNPERV